MACSDRWHEILSACHDGEAAPDEAARARAHAAQCRSCAATQEELAALTAGFEGLRDAAVPSRVRRRALAISRPVRRRHFLTAAVAAAAAAVALVFAWPAPRLGTALADELEGHHLKAFARAVPCDFESSDPAAVNQWLAAHVGYAVEVPALPGARLLGARRCKLRGVVTASLLYRRGDEAVTVFFPRAGTAAGSEADRLGEGAAACTGTRLGAHICARPGRFAVAESAATALLAVQSS